MRLKKLFGDDAGATAIEYGLIVALVAIGIIGSLQFMGNSVKTPLNTVSSSINTNIN